MIPPLFPEALDLEIEVNFQSGIRGVLHVEQAGDRRPHACHAKQCLDVRCCQARARIFERLFVPDGDAALCGVWALEEDGDSCTGGLRLHKRVAGVSVRVEELARFEPPQPFFQTPHFLLMSGLAYMWILFERHFELLSSKLDVIASLRSCMNTESIE